MPKPGWAQNHTCLCSFHGVDVNEGVLRGVHRGVGGAVSRVNHLLCRPALLLVTVHDLGYCPPLGDKVHLGNKKILDSHQTQASGTQHQCHGVPWKAERTCVPTKLKAVKNTYFKSHSIILPIEIWTQLPSVSGFTLYCNSRHNCYKGHSPILSSCTIL